MYLRHTIRKKDGKVHRYWTLVRSVRLGRRVIQQTVAQLGEIRLRCIAQPEAAQAALLDRLGVNLPKRMRLFENEPLALSA
jgi:hypothetical protein